MKVDSQKEKPDHRDVKKYNRIKIFLSIIYVVIGGGFLTAIIFTGFSVWLENWVKSITNQPYLAFLFFIFILGGMEMVITLPLSFYGGYIIEHRFELSSQSFWRWCWEETKGILVGTIIFTPLAVLFYFFLRQYNVFWWIPIGLIFFFFSILLAKLGPLLIFPLFYKFLPLEDETLKEQLTRISENAGLNISGIFSFNLSKNTKKANAAFTGLGRTRRILLADTLLENFSIEEIKAVTGHELGHYQYGHLWKGILMGFVLTFGGLFSANLLFRSTMRYFGGIRGDELALLPLLGLFLMGFGLVTSPIQNAVSRHFERQADRFAVKETEGAEHFITALEKLGKLNKADSEPHPIVEFFFYSHPSLKKRIESIKATGKVF